MLLSSEQFTPEEECARIAIVRRVCLLGTCQAKLHKPRDFQADREATRMEHEAVDESYQLRVQFVRAPW